MEDLKLTPRQMAAYLNVQIRQRIEALSFCEKMLDSKCMELSRQVAAALRASDTDTARDLAAYQLQLAGYRVTLGELSKTHNSMKVEAL